MESVNWKFNRNGALFVLRHDSEKVVKKSTIDNIKDILGNERPVKRVDTVLDEPQKITPVTREALFDSELELFSHQEIIITDRWHAMVFSVLTGTPCLLFGNSYGKGKHAYIDWLEHIDWINYTDETDVERIEELLQQLISQKRHDYDVKNDFRQLRDLIKNIIGNKKNRKCMGYTGCSYTKKWTIFSIRAVGIDLRFLTQPVTVCISR